MRSEERPHERTGLERIKYWLPKDLDVAEGIEVVEEKKESGRMYFITFKINGKRFMDNWHNTTNLWVGSTSKTKNWQCTS
ncbi:unnamed protein product [Arctia plantaginis]|uniref:Uncharacterized protein n=1 Tax=Arctia plantaginis TaxID=874455 RepID=A0A8S1AN19_ARCPL|nr:unnamed protein product [Arctia plantaginis]